MYYFNDMIWYHCHCVFYLLIWLSQFRLAQWWKGCINYQVRHSEIAIVNWLQKALGCSLDTTGSHLVAVRLMDSSAGLKEVMQKCFECLRQQCKCFQRRRTGTGLWFLCWLVKLLSFFFSNIFQATDCRSHEHDRPGYINQVLVLKNDEGREVYYQI